MTNVKCAVANCTNNENGTCQLKEISINPMHYGGSCNQYSDITNGDDYNSEFWKAINLTKRSDDTKDTYKSRAAGKRIECEGIVFYAEQDYRNPETELTEEKSGVKGMKIGDMKDKNKIEKFRKALAEHFQNHKQVTEYEDIESLSFDEKIIYKSV